jgi:hypothetical protein
MTMKITKILRILVILPVILTTMIAVTPVFAGAPVHSVGDSSWEYSWTLDCHQFGYTEDVVLDNRSIGTFDITTWFDENGNVERVFTTYPNVKFLLSSNGKTLNAKVSGPIHEYISENGRDLLTLGTFVFVTVPGHGPTAGSTGRLVQKFVLDEDGEWVLVNTTFTGKDSHWDWSTICEYFLN